MSTLIGSPDRQAGSRVADPQGLGASVLEASPGWTQGGPPEDEAKVGLVSLSVRDLDRAVRSRLRRMGFAWD